MQIVLICILIKQQKHVAINNYLITHFTKQTLNLNYLLLTLNVTVQLLNYPKQKSPFFFLNFKFSLNGGDLVNVRRSVVRHVNSVQVPTIAFDQPLFALANEMAALGKSHCKWLTGSG